MRETKLRDKQSQYCVFGIFHWEKCKNCGYFRDPSLWNTRPVMQAPKECKEKPRTQQAIADRKQLRFLREIEEHMRFRGLNYKTHRFGSDQYVVIRSGGIIKIDSSAYLSVPLPFLTTCYTIDDYYFIPATLQMVKLLIDAIASGDYSNPRILEYF